MLILSKPNLTLENSYLCVSVKIPSRQMASGHVLLQLLSRSHATEWEWECCHLLTDMKLFVGKYVILVNTFFLIILEWRWKMAGKFKSVVMFIAVVSIFCFVLNIAGTTSPLYACDACKSKTQQCPSDKGSDACPSKTQQR